MFEGHRVEIQDGRQISILDLWNSYIFTIVT